MKQTSNGNGSRPTATKRKTRVVTDTVSSRKKAADKMVADATVKQMSAALMSSDRSGNGKKVALAPVKKTADSSVRRADLKSSDAEKTRPVRVSSKKTSLKLSPEEIERLNTSRGLMKLLKAKNIKLKSVLSALQYEEELVQLQIELVKLQRWAQKNGKRIAILFEGRDAAGKGGAIRRFTEHLNPRSIRVVALPKPSEHEKGQWYFQRYSKQLPSAGEIVFFDRSWYNRAVVEPVNGFCSDQEYDRFMQQVTEYEHMLYEDGIMIIKFWFSISREEQQIRFNSRKLNPLKQWKLSPIDDTAQQLWDKYSRYKELMFSKTHTSFSPWIIVQANNKKLARLESIRYVLSQIEYSSKGAPRVQIFPDPNVVTRFHRNSANQD